MNRFPLQQLAACTGGILQTGWWQSVEPGANRRIGTACGKAHFDRGATGPGQCKAVLPQFGVQWLENGVVDQIAGIAIGQLQLVGAGIAHRLRVQHLAEPLQLTQQCFGGGRIGQAGNAERDFLRAVVEMLQKEIFGELVADQFADFGQCLILRGPTFARWVDRVEVHLFATSLVDGLDGPGG